LLSNSFRKLSQLINTIDVNRNNIILKKFLDSLMEDLEKWVKIIFIEQSAIDIHYFDDNLYSTILQIQKFIELKVNNEK